VITDIYQHPVVQGLRRDRDALQRRNDHLEDLLRVSLNRDLQTRAIEPLNPLAPGPFAPIPGGLLTIHVDALRIRANRLHRTRDPLIRILNGDEVWHCRAIAINRARMAEDYDAPLPGKLSAVCVLQTADPIEVLR
jgi:hypothetical protein